MELADDGLVLELGRLDADPGFVAVLFVGEEGFSASHLWLLPFGTAVVGGGFEGGFASGLAAVPPYTINLKQKCNPRPPEKCKNYHANYKIAFIKIVLISKNIYLRWSFTSCTSCCSPGGGSSTSC